jgi:magnesium transporter
MRRLRMRRAPVAGMAPGTLVVDPDAPKPVLRAIAYGPDEVVEHDLPGVAAARELVGRHPVVWVNVDGLGDVAVLDELGGLFGVHRLALEDVVNVHQRAKVERYGEQLFVVARMPLRLEDGHHGTEQLSLFLGKGFLLSFQERAGDCFDPVRRRIREGKGRMRSLGPDYLAYALLDAVVDSYFPVLQDCGDRLDVLEDKMFARPDPQTAGHIHLIRRDLLGARRAVWPLRECLSGLTREPDELVGEETRLYLRDCYDHAVQIIDLLESYRDLSGGLMDTYLSLVSQRMNEIMKVLTIYAAIFIPLTFVAGIWGMNFDTQASGLNMPELGWGFGYPAALALMAILALGQLAWFRRKGWLGGPPDLPSTPAAGAAPAAAPPPPAPPPGAQSGRPTGTPAGIVPPAGPAS